MTTVSAPSDRPVRILEFIDEPLPLDVPPAPRRSIADVVRDRDGHTCRACGITLVIPEPGEPTPWNTGALVNLLGREPAGELPELHIAQFCRTCAADAQVVQQMLADGGPDPMDGWSREDAYLDRLLRLLYLENCSMAGAVAREVVSR
ncbi:hypothetical protein [Nesterenkonia sp. K-15-9-6]|uniref:hypothetical protein n=1 Tax=Nesterenkonia sp. K-15-9-6 TaxID=3093918 RepID=UPI004043C4D5